MNKIPKMLNEAYEDFGISKKIIYTTSETEYVIHPQLTFTFIATTHQNFRSYTSCKNKNLLAEG